MLGILPSRARDFGADGRTLDAFSAMVEGVAHAARVASARSYAGLLSLLSPPPMPQSAIDDDDGVREGEKKKEEQEEGSNRKKKGDGGGGGGVAGDGEGSGEKKLVAKGGFPSVVHRSLVAANLFVDDLLLGAVEAGEFVTKAMEADGIPGAVACSEAGQIFVSRAVKPLYDYMRLHSFNDCRQRTRIEAILGE